MPEPIHAGARRRRTERAGPGRRRLVVRIGMAVLIIGLVTFFGANGASPFHSAAKAATAGAASSCPSDGTGGCVESLPCNVGPCPTVDATPLDDVTDGQYVSITATNFPATESQGYSIRVALCSTSSTYSPDPSDPACLNGIWETQDWQRVQVPIAVDPANANLTEVAVPAFFDQSGEGNDPIPAHDILNQHTNGSFFCDNTTDPCAIEITIEQGVGTTVGNGPADSADNTLIFPLSYSAQNAGCPGGDPVVDTDSSFSLEHFIPNAVDATCKGATGVVALDTPDDDESVVNDFQSGGTALAFIDDPQDPAIQSGLAGTKYALIPVAVSGTAVGFLAGQLNDNVPYPLSQFDLTPTMVAGIMTSEYEAPTGALEDVGGVEVPGGDALAPPLNCLNLVGCPITEGKKEVVSPTNELAYTSFTLLNAGPPGDIPPSTYGAYMSTASTGENYQVTKWICNAPDTPFNVQVDEIKPPAGQSNPVTVGVTDTNLAGTTLTTPPVSVVWPPTDDQTASWVFPTCQGYSSFPAIADQAQFEESQNPAGQAKNIRTYAYQGDAVPTTTGNQTAGFGVMDSSEAGFYGLNMASIQNQDGNFVTPTAKNIEAGVEGVTACPTDDLTCPVGTYQVSYDTAPSGNAYPMPDITYAIVSTKPQPGSQATAIKNLLTNLVTYSHTAGALLPEGYAPLPTALYNAALTDISQDVVAGPSTGKGGSGSQSMTNVANAAGEAGVTNPESSPYTNPVDDDLTNSLGSTGSTGSTGSMGSTGSTGSGSGSQPATGPSTVTKPSGFLLLSLDEASRYLLPALIILALLCLIAGPLLYFAPGLRHRRRAHSAGARRT